MSALRTAIVTGSSRGIGRSIALALAKLKMNVVINYIEADLIKKTNFLDAQAVGKEVEAAGGRALLVLADVTVAADREKLVNETVKAFGSIDMLVNNAGVSPAKRDDLLEATEASFDRLMNINLKGPYFLTQLVAKHMAQTKGGEGMPPRAIVNMCSVSAYAPSSNRGDYCISKAGVAMATRLWAARLAEYGVNVYEIRPGIIATDMTGPVKEKYDKLIAEGLTPIKRWGQPEDVAMAVVAVAQGLLPFSTGQVLDVDGGFHVRSL